MATGRGERGQASIELIALLPAMAIVALALWQCALAARSTALAAAGAKAAARAVAIGSDPSTALGRSLPADATRNALVRADREGRVTVTLPVPVVVIGGAFGRVSASARFEPQGG